VRARCERAVFRNANPCQFVPVVDKEAGYPLLDVVSNPGRDEDVLHRPIEIAFPPELALALLAVGYITDREHYGRLAVVTDLSTSVLTVLNCPVDSLKPEFVELAASRHILPATKGGSNLIAVVGVNGRNKVLYRFEPRTGPTSEIDKPLVVEDEFVVLYDENRVAALFGQRPVATLAFGHRLPEAGSLDRPVDFAGKYRELVDSRVLDNVGPRRPHRSLPRRYPRCPRLWREYRVAPAVLDEAALRVRGRRPPASGSRLRHSRCRTLRAATSPRWDSVQDGR